MTISETDLVIVTPAPPAVQTPPPAPAPAIEAPPRVIRRRSRRRLFVAAAVAVAALAVAVAVWAPWSASSGAGAPAATSPPTYARLSSVTPTSIAFTWSPPFTDASVVGYEILRNGVVGEFVTPVQSSYNATGLATGRKYTFQVVAVYAHSISAPSAPIVATTR
jgi:hypothetical protein